MIAAPVFFSFFLLLVIIRALFANAAAIFPAELSVLGDVALLGGEVGFSGSFFPNMIGDSFQDDKQSSWFAVNVRCASNGCSQRDEPWPWAKLKM